MPWDPPKAGVSDLAKPVLGSWQHSPDMPPDSACTAINPFPWRAPELQIKLTLHPHRFLHLREKSCTETSSTIRCKGSQPCRAARARNCSRKLWTRNVPPRRRQSEDHHFGRHGRRLPVGHMGGHQSSLFPPPRGSDPLKTDWQRHVLASSGYLELGMFDDAAHLKRLSQTIRLSPRVLGSTGPQPLTFGEDHRCKIESH